MISVRGRETLLRTTLGWPDAQAHLAEDLQREAVDEAPVLQRMGFSACADYGSFFPGLNSPLGSSARLTAR